MVRCMTHVLDEAIAGSYDDAGLYQAQTHEAYANMVGPFGGSTAATVLHALTAHPEQTGEPLALTLNFAAPIAYGAWQIRPQLIRTNRTNQHWTFTVEQDGAVVGSGSAVFGITRDTWSDVEATPPTVPPAAEVELTPFPEFIGWARSYEKRIITGTWDSPSEDSTTTMWIRDAPARPLDFPALAGLSDTFAPRVFVRHANYMPTGTITMTTYFHATSAELAAHGDDYVLATARGARFGNGHFDQYGQLWGGPDHALLLATTHQLCYFKDPAPAQ